MDIITTLQLVIISISVICIFGLPSIYRARRSSKLPPGPFPFPIIGNILELGHKPHQSLAKLSKKYGPLMSLKLGSRTTIVVSSPEMAKLVLQKHDVSCCSRSVPSAVRSVEHEKHSLAWLPVENQWRNLRRISREQLFSVQKLDASQWLRREKLRKLLHFVNECSEKGRVVDIGTAAFTTTLNLISASICSLEFAKFNSDESQEMKDLVWAVQVGFGTPNLSDFFPVLEGIDPQGIAKRLKMHWSKLSTRCDEIIDGRMESGSQRNDLLQNLIDARDLNREEIKHMLLTLFLAGTETSASTTEWAMAELLRYPDKMLRVRDEIANIINEKGQVEESDIQSLPYLQAAVKETLRLHPPAPLLLPHKAISDVEINGYVMPKDAQIFTNVWAIGRDPDSWTEADVFMPERFLVGEHEHIDFKGNNFELIPFGAGRRICPGLPMAYRMVHLMVATFAGNFGWILENGMKPEELDMEEKTALTLTKAVPLKAIPIKL